MVIVKRKSTLGHQTKKNSIRKTILNTTKEYASATTIHGFTYVFDDRHSITARALWAVVVILAGSLTAFQMSSLYLQWKSTKFYEISQ